MIQNLIKQFNKPISKFTNNILKSSTFNHPLPFWASHLKKEKLSSNFKNFSLLEHQLTVILKSFLKKTFIIINKPLFLKTSQGLKINLLYYIPENYVNGKFNGYYSSFLKKKTNKENNYNFSLNKNKVNSKILRLMNYEIINGNPIKPFMQSKVNINNLLFINKTLNKLNELMGWMYFYRVNSLLINKVDNSKIKTIHSPVSQKYSQGNTELKYRIKFISMLLSKILRLNVTIEATRIKYPQLDSTILVEYLGLKSFSWSYSKLKKFIKVIPIKSQTFFGKPNSFALNTFKIEQSSSLLNREIALGKSAGLIPEQIGSINISDTKNKRESINIPDKNEYLVISDIKTPNTCLMGLHLKVAGRLNKQRIVPKKTIKLTNKGPSAPNSRLASQIARFEGKNKKGSFSITIRTGHSLRKI